MNAVSSRSHAIFTINVTARTSIEKHQVERRAKMNIIDLAGSERQKQTGATGDRLAEGAAINKSLTILGQVISKLADHCSKNKPVTPGVVPFRNSKLTFLLMDCLMGNCSTLMLAAVSPALLNHASTESTLRFASSVKAIKTKPKKNEDPMQQMIAALQEEIASLKEQLAGKQTDAEACDGVQQQIADNVMLLNALATPWEERLRESERCNEQRDAVLHNLGLSMGDLQDAWARGETRAAVRDDAHPYITNVCDDPLLSGCVTYTLPQGDEVSAGSDDSCHIKLGGLGMQPVMCRLSNHNGVNVEVVLGPSENAESSSPIGALGGTQSNEARVSFGRVSGGRSSHFTHGLIQVYVNNEILKDKRSLRDRDRLLIGRGHEFQVFIPQAARRPSANSQVSNKSGSEDVDDALEMLHHFLNPGSAEYLRGAEFLSFLRRRLGEEGSLEAVGNWKQAHMLVDEANDITDELRGYEAHELSFRVISAIDVPSGGRDGSAGAAPELWIQLVSVERLDEVPSPYADADQPPVKTHRTWPASSFQRRLEALRDLHHDLADREDDWDPQKDPNPWEDPFSGDEEELPAKRSNEKSLMAISPGPMDRDAVEAELHAQLAASLKEKDTLAREKDALAKELEMLKEQMQRRRNSPLFQPPSRNDAELQAELASLSNTKNDADKENERLQLLAKEQKAENMELKEQLLQAQRVQQRRRSSQIALEQQPQVEALNKENVALKFQLRQQQEQCRLLQQQQEHQSLGSSDVSLQHSGKQSVETLNKENEDLKKQLQQKEEQCHFLQQQRRLNLGVENGAPTSRQEEVALGLIQASKLLRKSMQQAMS
eukprot:gnl/MRDRNA2_/MRDRNA2_27189_c0_seq1.p1 gnl/MRDRNA2_/MRDRNA2_27189_c0~~gnl/MRDRNA2_/MRDRNA2_27189_c0_seq1.p1  ORF type:complete len:971 (+),score=242.68 gnl/MRDRNA2_/MRDRNA2_27189_c0_seq1:422-2914(+)